MTKTTVSYVDRIINHDVIRYVDRIVYKDQIKTVIVTKPDGTKIESHTDTKVSSQTADKTIEETKTHEQSTSTTNSTVASDIRSRYFIGGYYPIGTPDFQRSFYLSVGARLGNLPFFIEAVGQPFQQTLGLGVRCEF